MSRATPYNLKAWVEENRDQLRPPVGNKMVWKDSEFLVMVVGGPNRRKDFHVEEGLFAVVLQCMVGKVCQVLT